MELKDRLKKARKLAGLTQVQVSDAVDGLAQPSYSALERGESKSTTKIAELSALFGVSPIWLATGEGEPSEESGSRMPAEVKELIDNSPTGYVKYDQNDERVYAKLYDIQICCGEGATNPYEFEPLKKRVGFDASFFTSRNLKPEHCPLVYATNDSMENYIMSGDAVMVNKLSTLPKEGKVFAVWFDNEMIFRRIFKEGNDKLLLSADNKKYPEKRVDSTNSDYFGIIGEVVYRSG